VQVHGVGPTDLRFVNRDDDPRKKKQGVTRTRRGQVLHSDHVGMQDLTPADYLIRP